MRIAVVVVIAGLMTFFAARSGQVVAKTLDQRNLPVKVPPYASVFAKGSVMAFQRLSLSGMMNKGEIFRPVGLNCSSVFVVWQVGNEQPMSQYVHKITGTEKLNSVSVLIDARTRYTVDLLLWVPRSISSIAWKAGSKVLDRETGYHGYVPMSVSVRRIHPVGLRSELVDGSRPPIQISLSGIVPAPIGQSCQ